MTEDEIEETMRAIDSELACPACGSEEITTEMVERSVAAPFGPDVSYQERVDACQVCGTEGDFFEETAHAYHEARRQSGPPSEAWAVRTFPCTGEAMQTMGDEQLGRPITLGQSITVADSQGNWRRVWMEDGMWYGESGPRPRRSYLRTMRFYEDREAAEAWLNGRPKPQSVRDQLVPEDWPDVLSCESEPLTADGLRRDIESIIEAALKRRPRDAEPFIPANIWREYLASLKKP